MEDFVEFGGLVNWFVLEVSGVKAWFHKFGTLNSCSCPTALGLARVERRIYWDICCAHPLRAQITYDLLEPSVVVIIHMEGWDGYNFALNVSGSGDLAILLCQLRHLMEWRIAVEVLLECMTTYV